MEIDWRILIPASFAIIGSYFLLLRTILKKSREISRLMSLNQRADLELLRNRGEHAQETADLMAEHAKLAAALQGNVNDLTALLKEHNKSGWDGWLEKQRTRLRATTPQR
jgi:hypothetical protein